MENDNSGRTAILQFWCRLFRRRVLFYSRCFVIIVARVQTRDFGVLLLSRFARWRLLSALPTRSAESHLRQSERNAEIT